MTSKTPSLNRIVLTVRSCVRV